MFVETDPRKEATVRAPKQTFNHYAGCDHPERGSVLVARRTTQRRLVRKLKHVLLIKLHVEFPEKREVLGFERLLGMMGVLILNITDHPIKIRSRIRKCPLCQQW